MWLLLALACAHPVQPVSPAEASWTIDGAAVSSAEFHARVAALVGPQDGWFCAETNTGGITGWTQLDADGVRWRVRLIAHAENGGGGTLEHEPTP